MKHSPDMRVIIRKNLQHSTCPLVVAQVFSCSTETKESSGCFSFKIASSSFVAEHSSAPSASWGTADSRRRKNQMSKRRKGQDGNMVFSSFIFLFPFKRLSRPRRIHKEFTIRLILDITHQRTPTLSECASDGRESCSVKMQKIVASCGKWSHKVSLPY